MTGNPSGGHGCRLDLRRFGRRAAAPEVRRVVTKIDASGKAVVMLDGQVR